MIVISRIPACDHRGRYSVGWYGRSTNLCVHDDVVHSTTLRRTARPMPLSSSPVLPIVGRERGDNT